MVKNILIKKDFYSPNVIDLRCPFCSEVIEQCEICKINFTYDNYKTATNTITCAIENINNHRIHICSTCYEHLPNGEYNE